jgi:N-acetyl-beta-hexosaminidase
MWPETFTPKEKLFQILDYMALYKLNRFDLKLTDDDGWRIEIPGLPELTESWSQAWLYAKREGSFNPHVWFRFWK